MHARAAALLGLCVACSSGPTVEEISVTLPDAPDGTLFAVLNIGASDVVGRVGSVEALEGPTVQVRDPRSVYVLTFPGGMFGGYRGPDIVYESSGDEREGFDAVRFPAALEHYTLQNGALAPVPDVEMGLVDELRIPCDRLSASTRPAFEQDPEPRCPSGARARQALVSCEEIVASGVGRRTVITESETFDVTLAQRGCRIDMACADDGRCGSSFPMFGVLPPRLAAEGNEAMTTFASVADRAALCRRADDGTYACPDGSTFRLE